LTLLPLTAVYDANVLYGAFLRDVLLRLAEADLVRIHWTRDIHEEWTRALRRQRPDILQERLDRLRESMEEAFPAAMTDGYEECIESLSLPDPDDRHVLAAAIRAEAHIIVTQNTDDFPHTELDKHGVVTRTPDAFVIMLLECDFDRVCLVLAEHRSELRRPPLSASEYLDRMRSNHLPESAGRLFDMGCNLDEG
jgi:predicted nucleic acid-binding protein